MRSHYSQQISALWTVFLLALLFHTDLGLMPLFHGQSIANSHDTNDISWVLWLMLLFFLPPLFAIILPTFTDRRTYRIGHFWLTVFYSCFNLIHLLADLSVQPIAWYQIVLMTILSVIGVLLNLVSYRWMISAHREKYGDYLHSEL
jgi:hypothetical protein